MKNLKKNILMLVVGAGILSLLFVGAKSNAPVSKNVKSLHARPDGFLEGTWIVRCDRGHLDQVDGITRNHDCEKCGDKAVDGGNADVICPDGHINRVGGITQSHLCTQVIDDQGHICGKQCRR